MQWRFYLVYLKGKQLEHQFPCLFTTLTKDPAITAISLPTTALVMRISASTRNMVSVIIAEAVVPLDKFWQKLDQMQGGGIVININGAQDPRAVAEEVKRVLIRETNNRRLAWQ